MRIEVKNLTGKRIPPIRGLKRTIKKFLKLRNKSDGELNIVFMTDSQIKRLNRKYRKKNRPTDVLAFNMADGMFPKKGCPSLQGDIAISLDAAARQARYFGSSRKREIYLYIIHGILHLLGYDDTSGEDRRRMQKIETGFLERVWNSTT